jgi:hypothetical protein
MTLPPQLPSPSPHDLTADGGDLITFAMAALRGCGNFSRHPVAAYLSRLAQGDLDGFVARETPASQASLWSSACIAAGYMRAGDVFILRPKKQPRKAKPINAMLGL